MKLEKQVVSLELAQKLKELGVEQESYFKYCGGHTLYDEDDEGKYEPCHNTDLLDVSDEYCHTAGLTTEFTISAFTVAELGEMLPDCFSSGKTGDEENSWVCYKNTSNSLMKSDDLSIKMIFANTEADARAKMLIYLLENNLIK